MALHLDVKYQENYSRSELLLRALFGVFYIQLPHSFILMFLGIWGSILNFISFWVILFTGEFPQTFFEYQEKLMRWKLRVSARTANLVDGYPAFGMDVSEEETSLSVDYPETVSRSSVLLRALFGGIYVLLPHGFALLFRTIASVVLQMIAFWVVLFTGDYPESWHEFNVGTLRWGHRVNAYMMYMTQEYPPFSGKP